MCPPHMVWYLSLGLVYVCLFKIFFDDVDHFKFIEFVTLLLLLYFVFLAARHVGSQFPDQGLNPHTLHWKAKS